MTLVAGTTVGRYQILAPLGQGGMATVYKAYQPSLQREVALKVLRPGYAQDKEFLERFEREAFAIARLRHPHIVQVFDFESASGQYVLAMEYLEGGTLKERLAELARSGRLLESQQAVRIVAEVADALSYAHELGVVHRDVKPSNVMLTRKDWAVVTDFGIARILGATSHTQTGVGIGTPEYMAPEQGQGTPIDQRADIYSLGVMAYELLTGRVPYTADTPLAVVLAHIRDPLPLPSSVNPAVGPAVEKVLLRALAKDPAQRHSSATDLAEALRAAVAEDAKGATLGTLIVRRGAATAGAARTGRLGSLATRWPVVTAAVGVVVAMTTATVIASGTLRGSPAAPPAQPTPILSSPSAATGPSRPASAPAAASTPPGHAVPAKGPLFYQAKLDGTSFDVINWQASDAAGKTVPTSDPTSPQIRFVPGAIELVAGGRGTSAGGELNMPARASYVAELDFVVAGPLGRGIWFNWQRIRGCTGSNGFLSVRTFVSDETLDLWDYLGPGQGHAPLTGVFPIANLKSGGTHTIALTVTTANVILYVDEKQLAEVPYSRCAGAARAQLVIGSDTDSASAGLTPTTVRITGLRYYALP